MCFLFFRNGGFESENDPVSKIVANKRYYDAKLRFFYTYSLRTETRESEALFCRKSKNVPNNVFPIFWWKRYADNSDRKTLFIRSQSGY